ncbi:hypothetical protein LTR85_001396 [Meristemomyces frigidus]|nr:hypothetical protein LTR85_001396 [Meristemomyces frigidus]
MTSPLLKLPAELRNDIYERLAWLTETIKIGSAGCIAAETALLAICHQIRDEALPVIRHIALLSASTIRADVHNFDFAHVIEFIASLGHGQIHAIEGKRFRRISISMDELYKKRQSGLMDWLSHCNGPAFSAFKAVTEHVFIPKLHIEPLTYGDTFEWEVQYSSKGDWEGWRLYETSRRAYLRGMEEERTSH